MVDRKKSGLLGEESPGPSREAEWKLRAAESEYALLEWRLKRAELKLLKLRAEQAKK